MVHKLRNGIPVLEMGDTELRFVEVEDGRGEGLQAIDIATDDTEAMLNRASALGLSSSEAQVTLCGTHFNFVNSSKLN